MKITVRIAIFLTFLLLSRAGMGQFQFSHENLPPVANASGTLDLAWAGGLNAAQYSLADVNGDGRKDLVLFDRTNANIQTFLNQETRWEYAPLYERYFPEDLEGWMLLRDYDCDGKEDLFSRSPFGIRVFRNVSNANGPIQFELFKNIVFTEGNSGQINLQVNITDIPAIADIDSDGDLDILTFDPGLGGNVEYHQNMSLETYGTCDSLEYVRVVDSWGDFQECFCQDFAFGETCEEKNGGRILHASGKALLAIDFDDDGDKDLVYGDESCDEVQYLENIGDKDNAQIRDFSIEFPNASDPAIFSSFPASFSLDLDFDGEENLVFAPNVFTNFTGLIDFQNSNWWYVNNGSTGNPDYVLAGKNFLQEQMVDLGENAAPALGDIDGDGDYDLLVGHSRLVGTDIVHAIAVYENTGGPGNPVFEETELDYLGFSSLEFRNIQPFLYDYDQDGRTDLLISGTDNAPIKTIYFFRNSSDNGLNINTSDRDALDIDLTTGQQVTFMDADLDGTTDLLAGTTQGNLQYYRGTGGMDFELVQNDYAGIITDPSRPSLVPLAMDLNDNNEPELLSLDRSGRMRVFEDVRLSPTPEVFEDLILEETGQPLVMSSFGERTLLAAADLYNTGFPAIVMGSSQGGLYFLDNQSMDGPPVSERLSFIVYPNPTGGENNFVTIRSNRPGVFDIISTAGQTLKEDIQVPGNSDFVLDISTLPAGLYILRGRSNGFGSRSSKVIIY